MKLVVSKEEMVYLTFVEKWLNNLKNNNQAEYERVHALIDLYERTFASCKVRIRCSREEK